MGKDLCVTTSSNYFSIDYMSHNLSIPYTMVDGRILEVNTGPALNIHRDLDKRFMNLFIRNM